MTLNDSQDALSLFELLYGRCNDHDGDIILLERANKIGSRFKAGERKLAAAWVASNDPQYFKYNLLDGSQIGEGQVGGTNQVKTVVAFGIDVDAGKGDFHSRDHVLTTLNSMPVPPTAIINTRGESGGFHCYWILEQPYRINGDLDREFIQSAAKRWEDLLRDLLDGKLDTTSDLGRMLRPPSSKRENGDPVEIYIADGKLYSVDDLTLGESEPAADVAPFEPTPAFYSEESAGSAFMRSPQSPQTIAGILESLGYKVWHDNDGCYRFNRPGSESKMANGKFGDMSVNGVYQLVCFTPNAPFEVNKSLTLFQAYADLLHGGDHSLAASALSQSGFGSIVDSSWDDSDFEMPAFVSKLVETATSCEHVDADVEVISPAATNVTYEPGKAIPMPTELMDDGGWLEDCTQWIMSNMSIPLPELAFSSALHLLSLACARRWRDTTPFQTCTNLFVLSVAPTGSGKEMPRKCIKQFLESVEHQDLCGPDKLSSGPGLDALVAREESVGVMLDEVGDLVQQMCSPKAADYMASISSSLKILYTASSSGHWKGSCKVVDESQGVSYPHLSFIGSTTPGKFFDAMSADKISDGLIGRFSMFHSDITKDSIREGFERSENMTWMDAPGALTEAWKSIRGAEETVSIASVFKGDRANDDGSDSSIEEIEWQEVSRTQEAHDRFRQHDLDIRLKNFDHDKADQTVEMSIWSRSNEKTAKLALMLAISRWATGSRIGIPQIELRDMERAIALSNFLTRRLVTSIKSGVSDSEADADVKQFLKALTKKYTRNGENPVRESDMYRINPLAKLKAQKRDTSLLDLMVKQGYLIIEANPRGGGQQYRITEDGIDKVKGQD